MAPFKNEMFSSRLIVVLIHPVRYPITFTGYFIGGKFPIFRRMPHGCDLRIFFFQRFFIQHGFTILSSLRAESARRLHFFASYFLFKYERPEDFTKRQIVCPCYNMKFPPAIHHHIYVLSTLPSCAVTEKPKGSLAKSYPAFKKMHPGLLTMAEIAWLHSKTKCFPVDSSSYSYIQCAILLLLQDTLSGVSSPFFVGCHMAAISGYSSFNDFSFIILLPSFPHCGGNPSAGCIVFVLLHHRALISLVSSPFCTASIPCLLPDS